MSIYRYPVVFSNGWLLAEIRKAMLSSCPNPPSMKSLIDRQREDDVQHEESDADKLLKKLSSWRTSLISSKSES
jgi:hypothetical protein